MNSWPFGSVFPVCIHEHHKQVSRQQEEGMKQMDGEAKKIGNDHGI